MGYFTGFAEKLGHISHTQHGQILTQISIFFTFSRNINTFAVFARCFRFCH